MLSFGKTGQVPMILQAEAAECGLCCVVMVANFFGYRTDLVSMRRLLGVSIRGTTLKSIMEMAESISLSPRPLKLELDELRELKRPAILHWNLDHFVVLTKVGRRSITIHDPAVGVRTYTLREASHRFTGIALELSPRTDFKEGENTDKLKIWTFWHGTKGLGSSLFHILVLSLLIQAFALATPFYMQIVVDDVLIKHDADLLNVLAMGFLTLTLISVITKALRGFANLYLVNQLSYNIGNSLLHHLIRLPMNYFEKRHMGDIVSRFGSVKPVQEFITNSAITVLIDGLLGVTTLILMFIYSSMLTAVVVGAALLYAIFRALQFRPLRNANHENIAANAKLDSIFMESIRALQGIKLGGKELDRQNTWRNQFAESINTDARIGRLTISYELVNNLLNGCEYVLVIFLGAQAVMGNELSIGMLYAFMAYRSNFSASVISIINQVIQYWMLGLHLERLADITQTSKEAGIDTESKLILPIEGSLSSRKLEYRYSVTDPPIFSEFEIEVDTGDFVALYGPSGIGKTTLLKVLMGLVEATAGEVLVDGLALASLGPRSYRHHIASVMQNDSLFSGSLRDNVCFFDPFPEFERIQRVCELAHIHEDISATPMGYDSLIGDMGSSLSVGQQQRVLIARALYREPKILFLDEGTAHVDAATELKVMQNLKSLGITCIYVTHNQTLLSFADIVVRWNEAGKPRAISNTDQRGE